jgi:hypothetical protein
VQTEGLLWRRACVITLQLLRIGTTMEFRDIHKVCLETGD